MRICDICKEPSGEYDLCPSCFQKMQNGELNKCYNCKRWYIKDSICECVKRTSPPPQQPTPTKEKEPSGCLATAIISFILIAIIVLVIFLSSKPWENGSQEKTETSKITELTKQAPTVKFLDEQNNLADMIDVVILVTANDNYEEVIVKLTIYDKNETIIKETYLTQTNLTKGQTYRLTYTPSLSEIMNGKNVSCMLYKYK